ncbi:hypothetical protein BH11BAC4_BH11BAC4_17070 [soil metagenome]
MGDTKAKQSFLLPKVLSEPALKRIFAAVENLKHKTIFISVYKAGLRVIEAVA